MNNMNSVRLISSTPVVVLDSVSPTETAGCTPMAIVRVVSVRESLESSRF